MIRDFSDYVFETSPRIVERFILMLLEHQELITEEYIKPTYARITIPIYYNLQIYKCYEQGHKEKYRLQES